MKIRLSVAVSILGVAALFISLSGCQKTLSSVDATTANDASVPRAVANAGTAKPAGALLWSQNCARCHNLRNPRERSDREWDVIVRHMRVRANLTAEEHRLILAFLKSAN